MTTDVAKAPEISPFQLFLEANDSDYHTLNEKDEVNRSNVTDDATNGFTIIATLEKAIHGEGANLHSFIGFHFVLAGANEKRRFKSVTITIRFEDEGKPLLDDPEVVSIWPDTEYIWQGMTKEVQDTQSLTGTVKGGAYGGEAALEGRWQREERFVRNTPARLSGVKTLLKRRAGSHKNAMRIRMSENPQEESGVLRELRAGILVRRKREGPHQFRAYVNVQAEADMRYDIVRGLKKVVGAQHVTDPVLFEPGTNFLDVDDVAGINGSVPGIDMVRAYGEAASWTELSSVNRKVRKESGEWKDLTLDEDNRSR
ncbi:hypothetical protein CMUS01_11343 [Colletotrichum musicola]|uniref:Uncharacterized protein n=1 Tax=Colletotrichum musicola TaxID=2175873 RepID=A0A8H6N6Y5_9PEZI|nr:hypothetical protein CMUS01_11343 [Colletotrichum musicola]